MLVIAAPSGMTYSILTQHKIYSAMLRCAFLKLMPLISSTVCWVPSNIPPSDPSVEECWFLYGHFLANKKKTRTSSNFPRLNPSLFAGSFCLMVLAGKCSHWSRKMSELNCSLFVQFNGRTGGERGVYRNIRFSLVCKRKGATSTQKKKGMNPQRGWMNCSVIN